MPAIPVAAAAAAVTAAAADVAPRSAGTPSPPVVPGAGGARARSGRIVTMRPACAEVDPVYDEFRWPVPAFALPMSMSAVPVVPATADVEPRSLDDILPTVVPGSDGVRARTDVPVTILPVCVEVGSDRDECC